MRKRLGAFHADSHEEYVQKMKAIDSFDTKTTVTPIQVSPYNISCQMEALARPPQYNSSSFDSFVFQAKSESETDLSEETSEGSGASAT